MSAVRIRDLVDCPHYIPTISQWMWEEWDKSRGWTLDQSIKESESWCQRDALPWGIVAIDGDKLLGAMCMHPRDLDERPDLTPWMACLYVVPEARGRNVAMALTTALEQRAHHLGFKRLYMWTEHNPAAYTRYGYEPLFPTHWHGLKVMVMAKDLK